MVQIVIGIVVLLCVFAFNDWSLYDQRDRLIMQIEQESVKKRKKKRSTTVFGEGEYSIGTGFGADMKVRTERDLRLLITVSDSGGIIFRVLKGIIYYRGEMIGKDSLSLYVRVGDLLKTEDGTILYVEQYQYGRNGGERW